MMNILVTEFGDKKWGKTQLFSNQNKKKSANQLDGSISEMWTKTIDIYVLRDMSHQLEQSFLNEFFLHVIFRHTMELKRQQQ